MTPGAGGCRNGLQPVHVRDNFDLPPNGYRITLLDTPVGEGEVQPGMELAINPGQVFGALIDEDSGAYASENNIEPSC